MGVLVYAYVHVQCTFTYCFPESFILWGTLVDFLCVLYFTIKLKG